MKVWSRGLGKQSLYTDWFKTDIKMDGKTLVVEGIVRDKGIIWDCKFFFVKEDIPGLLRFLLSGPVFKHFLKNWKYIPSFFKQRYIKRAAGKEKLGEKKPEATATEAAK
jgi:hypothetical protein